MRLYEFAGDSIDDNSPDVKLVGILKQIQGRLEDTGSIKSFSLSSLLNKLRDAGLSFSEQGFRDIAQGEPISNIISDIQGDKVVFVGQESEPEDTGPDESEKTIDRMSKKATKKPEL